MTDDRLAPLSARVDAPSRLPVPGPEHGLTWRGLDLTDVDPLLTLVSAIEEHDQMLYRSTREEVLERVEGSDPAANYLGGFDEQGRMRAFAAVSKAADDAGSVRVFLDGGVEPALRGHGLGSAVLHWELARSRQILAESDRAVPGRIVANVEDDMTESAHLLERHGFERRRWYTDLRRDLAAPLPPLELERPLQVVPWTADLDEHIRMAHNESFADHWGSEPLSQQTWQQGRAYFAPEWSFMVLDRTSDRAQVVGYLLSGRYEQDWSSLGWSEGYIDLLGVRPGWRGRKVATSLVTAAMGAYRDSGIEYASVGIDSGELTDRFGLFGTLGFEPIRRSTMYAIEL